MLNDNVKFKVIFFTILFFSLFGWAEGSRAACSGSSPTRTAADATYAEINACLAAASDGDTINVPAGSATWSSQLSVNKQVSIIGAGVGSTVITNGRTGEYSYLIAYGTGNNNALFRVSGFTFNLNNGAGIQLSNDTTNPPLKMVRIDHNRFYNSTQTGAAIQNWSVYGVIDHNTFNAMRYPVRLGWGTSFGTWNWNTLSADLYGTENNIYFENNTVTDVSTTLSNQDEGGRYVFRYNSLSGVENYPWFDIHGGRGALRSGMGGELYGNTFNNGGYMMSHRGGRLAMHHNQGTGAYHPYNNDTCPMETRERMNNTYVFQNRESSTGSFIGLSDGGSVCSGDIVENSSYWVSKTSFNGTVGVGAGTLVNRPVTCTTGVGYWATNQSTTDLTGMVGVNPATPISGTLYKCTATNTWTAFYTPYTYPHPLTGGGTAPPPDTTAPAAPQGLSVS